MWLELFVQENGVSQLPRLLLQRQRNQISKPSFGQRVLIREKPVIGTEPDFGTPLHCLGQKMRTQLACQTRWNGLFEEQPDVAAVARTRPFQGGWQVPLAAGLEECVGVLLPVLLVEIDRQEVTGLVPKHGVDTHHEIPSWLNLSGKMPPDNLIRYRKKAARGTIGALDSWLLAHPSNPLVRARWRIAGFSRLAALEPDRINICSSPEQRSKQSDLSGRGRILIDHLAVLVRTAGVLDSRLRESVHHSVGLGMVYLPSGLSWILNRLKDLK